jgi:hypothetical protein
MSAVAYLVAEWRLWRSSRSHVGLLLALVAAGASLALVWLGPYVLSLTLPGAALVLGWSAGDRHRPGRPFRKLLLAAELAPGAAALGKALACLAEASFTLLVLSPPAILLLALWQRGPAELLLLISSFISGFLLSAAVGFLTSLLLGGGERLTPLWFFAAWLPAATLVDKARVFSPFAQAWAALGAAPTSQLPFFLAVLAELVIAALLFAAGAPAVALARRRDAAA